MHARSNLPLGGVVRGGACDLGCGALAFVLRIGCAKRRHGAEPRNPVRLVFSNWEVRKQGAVEAGDSKAFGSASTMWLGVSVQVRSTGSGASRRLSQRMIRRAPPRHPRRHEDEPNWLGFESLGLALVSIGTESYPPARDRSLLQVSFGSVQSLPRSGDPRRRSPRCLAPAPRGGPEARRPKRGLGCSSN
jgi:hypothetical protein